MSPLEKNDPGLVACGLDATRHARLEDLVAQWREAGFWIVPDVAEALGVDPRDPFPDVWEALAGMIRRPRAGEPGIRLPDALLRQLIVYLGAASNGGPRCRTTATPPERGREP